MNRGLRLFCFVSTLLVAPATTQAGTTLGDLVARHRHSVAWIEVESTNSTTGAISRANGTGYVLSEDGFIMTAGHLFSTDGASLVVRGRLGSRNAQSEEIEVIQIWNVPDVALLKFKNTGKTRAPIPIGDPALMKDGDRLYVMGFPGTEEWFQDEGTLSGKGGPSGSWTTTMYFGPGISGGPVLNQQGEVIGIAWGGAKNGSEDLGRLNRVLPVNLLSAAVSVAGVRPSARRPLGSMTPDEQIAELQREGHRLLDGGAVRPIFSDGSTTLEASREGGSVRLIISAPRGILPSIRVDVSQDRNAELGVETNYGVSRSGEKCVSRMLTRYSMTQCGAVDSKAEFMASLPFMRNNKQLVTYDWKIPATELGPDGKSALLRIIIGESMVINQGFLKLVW